MKTHRIAAAVATALTLFASSAIAATPSDKSDDELASKTLVHDAQCDVMKDQFAELTALQAAQSWHWSHSRRHYPFDGRSIGTDDVAEAAPTAAKQSSAPASAAFSDSAAGAESSGPGSYTKTNNQEQGVDEADIVKTDGRYIYTLSGNEVVIVKSWPADEAKVVSRLKFGNHVRPSNLFLNGDKLVAISYLNHPNTFGQGDRARNWYGATRISVVDIRNRANPYVVRHIDVEGHTNQARMIGNDVYVVTNAYMSSPPELARIVQSFDGWPEAKKGADAEELQRKAYELVKAHIDSKIDDVDFEHVLPHRRISGYRGKFAGRDFEPLTKCQNVHVPRTGVQHGMVSLVHFDLRKPWKVNASSVFGHGWQVYGSEEAIYVAMPNYSWLNWFRWYSKNAPDYSDYNSTNIHKFELNRDVGKPRYASSGRVRGYLLNQFSMSEHNGDLRVATTDQNWWWGGRQNQPENQGNHIYVLRPDGNQLATIGRVEGLAPGERIYAARMFGDKGYIVTFRQTDPLYTLDLSDPTRPEVAGELKINGFSNYIHPIAGDKLLTVGQDADDEGRVKGAHLQIFDVSDPSEPTRTHHHTFEVFGYSYSAAQYDHKAFTFDHRTGTLALPISYRTDGRYGRYFNGIFIFDVDPETGFEQRGKISHEQLVTSWRERQCEKNPRAYHCRQNSNYNWGGWAHLQRSIIMDDKIFTLSNLGLMAHDLDTPARPLSVVELAQI